MIRLKRIGAALVLILLLLLPAGVTQAQPQDLAGHWAEAGILEWLERGWMECCEDGSFNPDAEITRGEFIAYVNWIFGFFDTVQVDFPDLPGDHQYWDEIASGVAAGYLAGYADGTIRPDKPISRLEAAVILAKIAGLTRPEESLPSARFTDAEDIPAWGRDFVEAVAAVGLMQGYEDGSFRPLEHLTRAEVIVLLDKAPGIMEEYMTSPGYLGITPAKADSGSVKELMLYYHLGDIFAGGTVTFHLPPEMVATAGRDMVVISDIDGNSKKIVLEPRHIAKGGQEVTVTGITASEKGVVMLYLAGEEIPEPGYHYFRVTADADGPAGPKGQSYNGWLERIQLFSQIPSGYEGSLAVSPGSARSDSRESLTITYTLGHEFGEGWVEFTLPGEITATPGQDKLVLGGREELLTEAEIRDGGQKVLVRGLTGKKGDELVLTLVDKMIPGPGPHFFSVRADADGEGTGKPATQGTGREFMAFLAYSELDDKGDQINGFIEAMNGGDVEEIAGFLADDVVLVDHHGDGRLVLFTSREDVADEIDNIVNFYYDQVDIDLGSLKALGDNIWSVEGRASEYSARAVASLYPDTGFTGFGCTIKFFLTDNKICYVEFLWHREDEELFEELTGGMIGVLLKEKDSGEVVLALCAPGFPAEKAGLKAGDIIVAVDGVWVEELMEEDYGLAEVRHRLLGKAGSKLKLTIDRNGEVFDVEIVRAAN